MENDKNLVDRAYSLIADRIFKFMIPPGAPVSDFTLSKTLNMSRTPIRSAILILESQGIVEKTNSGFRVTKISKQKIDNLYEARLCVELGAMRLASEKGVPSEKIRRMRNILIEEDACLRSGKYSESLEKDLEFHQEIVGLCDNDLLQDSFKNLHLQMRLYNAFALAKLNEDSAKEYSVIVDYLEAGEGELAVKTLCRVIKAGKDQKIKAIEKFGMDGLEGMYNFVATFFRNDLEETEELG